MPLDRETLVTAVVRGSRIFQEYRGPDFLYPALTSLSFQDQVNKPVLLSGALRLALISALDFLVVPI